MMKTFKIRMVSEDDTAEVLKIYAHYVRNTIISFEYEAPSHDEYLERIRTNMSEFPWLVCLENNRIIGYAYAAKHRYRTAYQWSPESTVYLSPEAQGKGIGRVLYETLFSILRLQGYFNVYAGVGLPNEKSVGFHEALGFEELGVFKKVGYKHGNWHDTKWFQLHLTAHIHDPPKPKPITEIQQDEAYKAIMFNANQRLT